MNVVVRTLLIWMLTLAVPLQGASAATMASCGPSGHTKAVASAAQSHAADTHEAAGHASHHHPGALTPADTAAHQGAVADPTKASHKCSACASCCSVGALPSVVSTVPAPEVPPTVFAALAPAVKAFAADGPERPPRLVLA